MVIVAGLVAIFIMVIVDDFIAGIRKRRAQPGTIVICGLLGMAWFLAMLHSQGAALP